jgi:hypothetical protein
VTADRYGRSVAFTRVGDTVIKRGDTIKTGSSVHPVLWLGHLRGVAVPGSRGAKGEAGAVVDAEADGVVGVPEK